MIRLVNGQSPDAGTLTTNYGYDQVGNKIAQTDAEGRTTRWEYDAMGRETARILPGGQRETKAYNAAGELVEATDFNGVTTRYAYDSAGRLSTIDYPNDADVTTTYTDASERNSVTDGRGQSTWNYDARGRVLQSVDADGHVIEYQYDNAGNLIARISPSQSLVYEHDALNRIVAVTRTVDGEAPMVTRYEYDDAGNRKAMLGGDGTRTDYGYDARHRLRNLVKTTALGALLVGMNYDVDASGMRTAVEEYDPQGTVRTVEYDYDSVKRLTEERIDHRDDANDRTTSWTYDRVGNRLTQVANIGPVGAVSTATTTYGYDGNDRLLTETVDGLTTTYTYDANGNTKSKAGPDGATSYEYDDANRLVEATTPEGVSEYVYNADGLRVRQSVTPSSGPDAGTTTTTWYVQDAGYAYAQVIEQYTAVGTGARRLSGTWTFADDLVSQTRYDEAGSPNTAFLQMDGFGSTRWVTDESGQITDSIDYDAFGNEIARTGATEVEHLYRGERWDENVGAYDLRARLYLPGNGRFLTQDSFVGFSMDPPSLHKYSYTHNNPIHGTDPSGHFTLGQVVTAVNVTGNVMTVATIGVNILTGNYVSAAGMIAEEVVYSKLGVLGRPVAHLSERALGLYYRVFGRTVKLRLSKAADGDDLAFNLGQVGVSRPPNTQAHHIVAGKSAKAQEARDVLDEFDIDINSPTNGVFLPDCKSAAALGAIHCGSHSFDYMEMVNERIVAAASGGKISVLNELGAIKLELLAGTVQLNKKGVR